jgi:hypothetical protein
LARPVQPAWAKAMPELPAAEDLGLPCKRKRSQAGRGRAAGAARWIQRPGLLPRRRQMLCSFFLLSRPDGKNCPAQVEPYALSQPVIRLCCDFSNARTIALILPAHRSYADRLHCASAATIFASSDRDRLSSTGRCRGSARRSAETFLPRFVVRRVVVVPHRVNNGVPRPKSEASGGFRLMFVHEYCG